MAYFVPDGAEIVFDYREGQPFCKINGQEVKAIVSYTTSCGIDSLTTVEIKLYPASLTIIPKDTEAVTEGETEGE